MKKIQIDKLEKLKKQLAGQLHEEVTLTCSIYGTVTFKIGDFLETGVVSTKCAQEMPAWHEDQMVFPTTKALMHMVKDMREGA
jgi:hypothetical protein|tara:strand:+ start:538 stop:786 length:249 start_codon:yes stop_codon:yes gene_type:complete